MNWFLSDGSDMSDWSDWARMLLALLLALACSCTHAAPSISWQRGPDMPSAHDYLGCGMLDGMFVVAGGAYWENDQKHYGAGTIAYSPTQDRWIRLIPLPEPGAYGASAVIGDQLLIAGGADSTGALTRCCRLLRVNGRLRWESLPDLPRPLWGASGAVVGSRFFVLGGAPGMDVEGMKRAQPSLLVLDMSAVKPEWVQLVGPGMPDGRVGAASAVVGTRLFIFGGYGLQADGTLGNFGDAYVLDLGQKLQIWRQINPLPIASRWTSARAFDARYIGLFGGYAESPVKSFLDKVWLYDTQTDEYTVCSALTLPVATMASGVRGDGTVYLAGGEDMMRHRSAAFFVGVLTAR